MANNKVQLADGTVLMDTTGVTVTQDTLLAGYTALDRSGATITGTVATAPASSTTPAMDGTADAGSEDAYARGDHVHPTDTSRQAQITASGILKGNGSGGVSAATAGTDYQTPLTAGTDYLAPTGQAAKAKYLSNYYHDGTGTTGRPASANLASDNYGGMKKFLATGSMTEGKPSSDGHIIHMDWDNGTRWASQLYVSNSGTLLGIRGQTGASTATNGGWTDWKYAAMQGDAPAAHEHAADDITSGTLPVSRGGTGASSFTANRAIISGSSTTGAFTTRAITNNTAATTAITGSTNLVTMNTLRYALNRTTGPGTADTNYTTSMMRPIKASTTDLTAGSSSLTSGTIYLVYEA